MTNALEEAIARVITLPAAAQEKIGEELLQHIDKVERLRAKIDKGIASLDRGEGRMLDMNDVIRRARQRYEGK